jgi:hypothetical protein
MNLPLWRENSKASWDDTSQHLFLNILGVFYEKIYFSI